MERLLVQISVIVAIIQTNYHTLLGSQFISLLTLLKL